MEIDRLVGLVQLNKVAMRFRQPVSNRNVDLESGDNVDGFGRIRRRRGVDESFEIFGKFGWRVELDVGGEDEAGGDSVAGNVPCRVDPVGMAKSTQSGFYWQGWTFTPWRFVYNVKYQMLQNC